MFSFGNYYTKIRSSVGGKNKIVGYCLANIFPQTEIIYAIDR